MTRKEAERIIYAAYVKDGRPKYGPTYIVLALAALGLLKLDEEPKG